MGEVAANIPIIRSPNMCLEHYRYAKLLGTLLANIRCGQICLLLKSVFCTEIFPEKKTPPITNIPSPAKENVSPLPAVIQDYKSIGSRITFFFLNCDTSRTSVTWFPIY